MTFCDMVKTGGRSGLSHLSRGARETQFLQLKTDSGQTTGRRPDKSRRLSGHQGPKKIMPTDNSAGRSDRSGCQPYRFQSSVLRLWQGQGQCTDHIRQVRGRGDNRTDKGQEASQPQPHLGVTGSLIAKRYK